MSDPKYEKTGDRLDHLAEECAEVISAIMKAKRFGIDNFHPKTLKNNREAILDEIVDLLKRVHEVNKEFRNNNL